MKKALLALLTYLSLLPSLCAMTHSEDADSLVNAAHHYYSEYRYMDALDALAKAVERADATSNEIAITTTSRLCTTTRNATTRPKTRAMN